jgi:PRTRC genetic system protein B
MHVNIAESSHRKAHNFAPTDAFIIHKSVQSYDDIQILTHHSVRDGQLSPGTVISNDSLNILLESASDENIEFIPRNVICKTNKCIIFTVKESVQIISMVNHKSNLGYDQFLIPLPAHVLYAIKVRDRLEFGGFAIQSADEIEPDTRLFKAVNFNTNNQGVMCIGTVDMGKDIRLNNIPNWIEGWFGGVNSATHCEFLKDKQNPEAKSSQLLLSLNKADKFNYDWLMSSEIVDLKMLLNRLNQKG